MPIKRGHLYVIDFNPRIKTKPGKLRPALVIQSDLVNEAEYPQLSSSRRQLVLWRMRGFFGSDSKRTKEVSGATAIFFSAK
jgi:PemK-like, MazF-like toxin of type II toxin-antitoxin system